MQAQFAQKKMFSELHILHKLQEMIFFLFTAVSPFNKLFFLIWYSLSEGLRLFHMSIKYT